VFFFLFNAKNSRPISAENSPKVPLDEENEVMKQKLSQLTIEPSSSNLQVN
jgi:hypothetical protein